MSNKGIFTALSGAMAQNQRLDTISNNIANVNTAGFKKDNQTFYEYLSAYEKQPDVIQVPRVPASIESFYSVQGGDRGYVDSNGTYTDYSQGSVKATGNPLDVALEGNGFMEVLTPGGVRYMRGGSLKIDGQGRLVNNQGYPVLQSGEGQAPEERMIQMNTRNGNVTVSYNGDLYQGGDFRGQLSLVNISNNQALKKMGSSLYSVKDQLEPEITQANTVKVHQGYLESSNVNIIDEMTKMIEATRGFESNQKAMRAFDQMNEKLVNIVPRSK